MTLYIKDFVYRLIFIMPSSIVTFLSFPYAKDDLGINIISLIACSIAIISTTSLLLKMFKELPEYDKIQRILNKSLTDKIQESTKW